MHQLSVVSELRLRHSVQITLVKGTQLGDNSLLWAKMNMMETIKNWIRERILGEDPHPQNLRRARYTPSPRRQKQPDQQQPSEQQDIVEIDPEVHGTIESNGPGKNVLIRNRFVREETGTHETLKILDDSMIETGEEPGIDPYNTGGFDRSKKWDQRFRK